MPATQPISHDAVDKSIPEFSATRRDLIRPEIGPAIDLSPKARQALEKAKIKDRSIGVLPIPTLAELKALVSRNALTPQLIADVLIAHHSAGLDRPVVESVWNQDPVNQPGLNADLLPINWKIGRTEKGQTRLAFPAKPEEKISAGFLRKPVIIPAHIPRLPLADDRNTFTGCRVFAIVSTDYLTDGEGSQTMDSLGNTQPQPEIILTDADFPASTEAAPTDVAFSMTREEVEALGANPVADGVDHLKDASGQVPSINPEDL